MNITRDKASSRETPMPAGVKPMLCTLLKEPFQDPAYLFEIKWDGYRIMAFRNESSAKLYSRGGHDYTKRYPPITRALHDLPHNVVLDGEAVVLNREGKPDFDALQKFNGGQSGVFYYVFDILWLDGRDLMSLPLTERKDILRELAGDSGVIRYSDHFDDGLRLFRQAEAMHLEGIIAKHRKSPYLPGHRGREWYKIPTEIRQEFVIGGWVESENRLFRTLLFGAYEGNALVWVGHAGGGFKEHEMPGILRRLKALEVESSPFANAVDYDGIVHWVKPSLVANIKFATFTRSGKIRKPAIFLGFREDKSARDVVREVPAEPPHGDQTAEEVSATAANGNWPEVEAETIRNETVLDVDPCPVRVYNVDRPLWKGITKAHLLQYYHAVSPWLLPYLHNRPLTLYVKLKGPNAPGVYIKDMEGRQPSCAAVFTARRKHPRPGKRDVIDYLVCNNTATLLYTINLGCIDVNPWTSTTGSPHRPDYIVIDLDPSDSDFAKAVEAARAAKAFFDARGLKAFPKTSGKTGIHLYLPCTAFTFPQARTIAGNICSEIHQLVPEITTTETSIAARGTRLFLDANQNDYADTVAAVYSVRPFRKPTVSAPLRWREVNASLDPGDFTIATMAGRLEKKGDLFAGTRDARIARANDQVLRGLVG